MAVSKLLLIYDPTDRVTGMPICEMKDLGIKEARLSIPDDLEGHDIYTIAKKLAEMLLEQL
jgi:hypothetical protein